MGHRLYYFISVLVKHTFSITTKQTGFLIQTMNEKDLYDWLYAINPLLAGKIR